MRVTNSMMISNVLYDLNTNMSRVNKYSSQLASNRRIVRLSDDSIGVLNSMNARQKLNRYTQYKENLLAAQSWVEQAESATRAINSALSDIYENLVDASTDGKNPEDRKNIAQEVYGLLEHIVQVSNTTVGSQYIFGGFNTSNPPFELQSDGKVLYNGLDLTDVSDAANLAKIDAEQAQQYQLEVGFSMKMDVSFNGVDLMGTGKDNIFSVVMNAVTLMRNGGSAEEISASIGDIQAAQSRMLTNVVTVGAKMTKVETLKNRYEDDIINYTAIKSEIEDIDQAEAFMHYSLAEATYRQALSVGARIIQPTLLDFLK